MKTAFALTCVTSPDKTYSVPKQKKITNYTKIIYALTYMNLKSYEKSWLSSSKRIIQYSICVALWVQVLCL